MPTREILRAVIFLHRVADKQDFTEIVVCIPDIRMTDLENGLLERQKSKEIESVQIGRSRFEATIFTDYEDQVNNFFEKIDAVGPRSSKERATPPEGEDSGSTPDVGSRVKELEEALVDLIDAVEEDSNGSSALDDEIYKAKRALRGMD